MRYLLAVVMAASLAPAADQSLLNMVMPEAKILVGVDVDHARDTVFGKFFLSQLTKDEPGLAKMTEATGFNPRRDLHEIIVASIDDAAAGSKVPSNGLVLMRGNFDRDRISTLIKTMGMGNPLTYLGQEVFTTTNPKDNGGFAILDKTTAILGNIGSVKSALERRKNGKSIDAKLTAKIQKLSASNDIWMMSSMPVSDIASRIPGPTQGKNGMLNGDAMKNIQQASAGLKFTPSDVRVTAEAVAGSAKDAGALADVVRFISGMVQLGRDKDDASPFADIIDSLQVKTEGNVFRLNITIPQDQLQQMWDKTPAKKSGAVRKV